MPILNNKSFKILETSIIEVDRRKTLLSYQFANGYYWYVEFFNIHSFKKEFWTKVIPDSVLESIKNKKLFLVISNYAESFLSVVDPIYELLILKLGVPEEQLILMTGARDILPTIKSVSEKFSKKEIKVIWSVETEKIIQIAEKEKKPDFGLATSNRYEKKFVNLNRNWRIHRPTFIALLASYDLINDGYVSLIESNTYDWTWKKNWDYMLEKHPNFRELFIRHKHKIISATPLVVDKNTLDINPQWYQPELSHVYRNSYFSVVSETNYYNNESRFLTEKTFTPMVNLHPFILLSPPKSLELLRERGYRTFHPFINEDYDNEHDDQKRMNMVLDETKRLCSLTEVDLKIFVDNCKDICAYNYHHLVHVNKPYVTLNFDN